MKRASYHATPFEQTASGRYLAELERIVGIQRASAITKSGSSGAKIKSYARALAMRSIRQEHRGSCTLYRVPIAVWRKGA